MDHSALLDRLLALLKDKGVRYCVIGGQAVNAYAEPLVSLDLDLAVATEQIESLEALLAPAFSVRRFEHSLNLSSPGSDLRVQFQTDPRYGVFVGRSQPKTVLGVVLPVASLEDVLQGKVWAAQDGAPRPSKRLKDLADIARLIEGYPPLRSRVPEDVLQRLV